MVHRAATFHAEQQRAMCESLARMQALWLQQMPDLDPLLDFDEAKELRLTALYWNQL